MCVLSLPLLCKRKPLINYELQLVRFKLDRFVSSLTSTHLNIDFCFNSGLNPQYIVISKLLIQVGNCIWSLSLSLYKYIFYIYIREGRFWNQTIGQIAMYKFIILETTPLKKNRLLQGSFDDLKMKCDRLSYKIKFLNF